MVQNMINQHGKLEDLQDKAEDMRSHCPPPLRRTDEPRRARGGGGTGLGRAHGPGGICLPRCLAVLAQRSWRESAGASEGTCVALCRRVPTARGGGLSCTGSAQASLLSSSRHIGAGCGGGGGEWDRVWAGWRRPSSRRIPPRSPPTCGGRSAPQPQPP